MRRRDLLLAALAPSAPANLRDVASVHVAIAEQDQGRRQVWGRIGGTAPEHESAAALAKQLSPFLPKIGIEPFQFKAHRASAWEANAGGKLLETAMPAPFEARFPDRETSAPIEPVDPDGDWRRVSGKWAFVNSVATTSTAFNIVREKLLYQRAVEHGAAGLLFSLPTPRTSRWKSVVPVDKPYAVKDERYPGGLRPIPCFSMCHTDSFFTGACENPSGIEAMVGLAEALARLPARTRKPDFYFLGLSSPACPSSQSGRSMNLRMSQGQATRSTFTFSRVTHLIPLPPFHPAAGSLSCQFGASLPYYE